MSIFSAGIVWDPREPLPAEYASSLPPVTNLAAVGGRNPLIKLRRFDPTRVPYPSSEAKLLPSAVVQEADRNVLPAVSISIAARITGDIAEVTVKQLFWNDADSPIHKGSYTFSLPNGCTVTGFTCRIGNSKVLTAIARPKAEAQEEFQQALAAHRTAALLDQDTTEIFTSSIGNVPANTRVNVEITYATVLKRRYGNDTNITTLTIPTYIANRYGQRPASLKGLDLGPRLDNISLRVEILESEHIYSMQSASHDILVDRGATRGQAPSFDQIGKGFTGNNQETTIVTLKEPTSWIETDFILSLDTPRNKEEESLSAWLEVHPTFENQAAVMVTIPRGIISAQEEISKTGEIIFIADRSGSMDDKMTNLRSAMHFFLKGIPVGRKFNIWCFGSTYEYLWNKSRVYDEESLRLALSYVESKFKADMGGTEILPALEAVITARDGALPCDVVVLTDGQVWRLDETLSLVRKARNYSNGAIRFFSLGLGVHVSHALVEGIAREGGGYSEVIPQAGNDGWEARMIAILKAALTTHVNGLRLDLNGLKAMTAPTNLQCLNPFQAHRIFLLLEQGSMLGNEKISLTFGTEAKRTSVDASIAKIEKPGTLIHSLSARAILDEFELEACSTSHLSGGYMQARAGRVGAPSLAESIACKYTLPSRWTSLFLLHQDEAVPAINAGAITTTHIEHRSLHDDRGYVKPVVKGRHQSSSSFAPPFDLSVEYGAWPLAQDDSDTRRRLRVSPRFTSAREGGTSTKTPEKSLVPSRSHSGYTGSSTSFVPQIRSSPAHYFSWPNEACTRKEFISHVLNHQAFDGSIGSGVLDELSGATRDGVDAVKIWLCTRQKVKLDNEVIDRVATTTFILQVLKRDYKEHEDLWTRMREKGLEYVRLQLQRLNLEEKLFEYSRSKLDQLSDEICLERKLTPSDPLREVKAYYDPVKMSQTLPESNRVLVQKAPTGE